MSLTQFGDNKITLTHNTTGVNVDVELDLLRVPSLMWDAEWNYSVPPAVDHVGHRDSKRIARLKRVYADNVKRNRERLSLDYIQRVA
jgi:hypothetical protein